LETAGEQALACYHLMNLAFDPLMEVHGELDMAFLDLEDRVLKAQSSSK
jgi:hypothetical protein